jgi:hypothetical protein
VAQTHHEVAACERPDDVPLGREIVAGSENVGSRSDLLWVVGEPQGLAAPWAERAVGKRPPPVGHRLHDRARSEQMVLPLGRQLGDGGHASPGHYRFKALGNPNSLFPA